MLNEAQIMTLRTIERMGSEKPKKSNHKVGYTKPPELPVVRENVSVLLRDGLVRSMGPHSKVVRISNKGRAYLASLDKVDIAVPPEGTVALHGNDIVVAFETRDDAELAFDIIEEMFST